MLLKRISTVLFALFSVLHSFAQLTAEVDSVVNTNCNGVDCSYSGPTILINEVMMSPSGGFDGSMWDNVDPSLRNGEWIELYNPDACKPVDVSCYTLGNSASDGGGPYGGGYTIPQGTIVPAQGFLVLRGRNAAPVNPALLVANGGNTIELIADDPNVCISAGATRLWFPNAGGWFAFYDQNGVVQDAIKWNNPPAADLNGNPCLTGGTGCAFSGTLASYNAIPNARKTEISGVGTGPNTDRTFQRQPDGGGWGYNRNNNLPTKGECNTTCNPPIISTCTGKAIVIASGGVPPYSYLWNDPRVQRNDTAVALCAGIYCCTITDDVGTEFVACVEVTDTIPWISVVDLGEYCVDAPNDTVRALPSGGTYIGAGVTDSIFSPAAAGPGLHNITYDYTDPFGCQNDSTIDALVHPLPPVVANADTLEICFGDSAIIYGTGAVSYTWKDGIVDSTYVFPVADSIFVVTGVDANGCENVDSLTIIVHQLPIVVANLDTMHICFGDSAQLTGSGAATYEWEDGITDGDYVFPIADSTFYVKGTDSFGCINYDTIDIQVEPLPIVVANADTLHICFGDSVFLNGSGASTYVWDDGVADQSYVFPTADSSFQVTGTSAFGCINYDTIDIQVEPLPVVVANADTLEICFGDSVFLNGSGADSYVWDNGVNDQDYVFPIADSSYSVEGTSVFGCKNRDTVDIIVHQLPFVVAAASKTLICLGDSVLLFGLGANTYEWENGAVNNAYAHPVADSTFYVEGTDIHGCKNTNTVSVALSYPMTAGQDSILPNCIGDAVTLSDYLMGHDSPGRFEKATGFTGDLDQNTGAYEMPESLLIGTYQFNYIVTPDAPCPRDTAVISILGKSYPRITETGFTCAIDRATFTATFNFFHGDTVSYEVAPTLGTINSSPSYYFESTPLDTGVAQSFTLFDQFACKDTTVTFNPDCGCKTDAGTMSSDTVIFCVDGTIDATTLYAADSINDGNDLLKFYLHEGSGTSLVNPVDSNFTGVFSFNEATMTRNQVYFISPVMADNNSGDLRFDDVCLNISVGVPVVWRELPVVDVTPIGPFCVDAGNASLSSNISGGTFSGAGVSGVNFSTQSAGAGNHKITYVYTDGFGCTNEDSIRIVVNALPNVEALVDTAEICFGDSVLVFAQGADVYNWEDGVQNNQYVFPTTDTLFKVMGTDANGCINYDTVQVLVNALPIVIANADTLEVCVGDSVYLNGSGATTYEWQNGVTDADYVFPTTDTTYYVLGTDDFGCKDNDVVSIVVNPLPNVVARISDDLICIGTPVVAYGEGAETYEWENGYLDNTQTYPTTDSTYYVEGTDVNGCKNTDAISVSVSQLKSAGVDTVLQACIGETVQLQDFLSGHDFPGRFEKITAFGGTLNENTGEYVSEGDMLIGNYPFYYIVTPDAPCPEDTAVVLLQEKSYPRIQDVDYACSEDRATYTVSFEIFHGDTNTYEVQPAIGNISFTSIYTFQSDPIDTISGQLFTIFDQYTCDDTTITVYPDCGCKTDAGTMASDRVEFCGLGTINALDYFSRDTVNDGNDILKFYLHLGSGTDLVDPVDSNFTGVFSFNPATMDRDQVYYVSPAMADSSGTNLRTSDVCYTVSQGTPVVWYSIPSGRIFDDAVLCDFDNQYYLKAFTENGNAPYTYQVEITQRGYPVDTIEYSFTNREDSVQILFDSTATIRVLGMWDAHCVGTLGNSDATVVIKHPYRVHIEPMNSVCSDGQGQTPELFLSYTGTADFYVFEIGNSINQGVESILVTQAGAIYEADQYTPNASVDYFIKTIIDNQPEECGITNVDTVTIYPIPTVKLSSENVFCEDEPIVVDAEFTGLTPFDLYINNGADSTFHHTETDGRETSFEVPTYPAGNYTIYVDSIVSGPAGCKNSFGSNTIQITVKRIPDALLSVSVHDQGPTDTVVYCDGSGPATIHINGFLNSNNYALGYIVETEDSVVTYAPETLSALNNTFDFDTVPGTYLIRGVSFGESEGKCFGEGDSVVVIIKEIPNAEIGPLNGEICIGDSAEIEIHATGDLPISFTLEERSGKDQHTYDLTVHRADTSVYLTPDAAGTVFYSTFSVVDNSQPVCANANTKTINFTVHDLPSADILGNGNLCPGDSSEVTFVLSAASPYEMVYSHNGNMIKAQNVDSSSYSLVANPGAEGGTWWMDTLVDGNGCIQTDFEDTVRIARLTSPEPVVSATERNGCAPLFTDVVNQSQAIVGCGFQSGSNTIWECADTANTWVFEEAGIYDFSGTVTDEYGCTADFFYEGYFEVYPNPTADFDFTPDPFTELDRTLRLNNLSDLNVLNDWTVYDGSGKRIHESNDEHTSMSYVAEKIEILTAQLVVTTEYGCIDSASKPVDVTHDIIVYVPNAFTPEGDGYNDTFFPVFNDLSLLREFNMKIFDRWGELIFETNDPVEHWDGTVNAVMSQLEVYNWVIVYSTRSNPDLQKLLGTVTLLK